MPCLVFSIKECNSDLCRQESFFLLGSVSRESTDGHRLVKRNHARFLSFSHVVQNRTSFNLHYHILNFVFDFQVRIGVLKHLYDFIKLLPRDLQKDYLPNFTDFLNPDNTRNWRFRQELAE